jgi:hypothetical protein
MSFKHAAVPLAFVALAVLGCTQATTGPMTTA